MNTKHTIVKQTNKTSKHMGDRPYPCPAQQRSLRLLSACGPHTLTSGPRARLRSTPHSGHPGQVSESGKDKIIMRITTNVQGSCHVVAVRPYLATLEEFCGFHPVHLVEHLPVGHIFGQLLFQNTHTQRRRCGAAPCIVAALARAS